MKKNVLTIFALVSFYFSIAQQSIHACNFKPSVGDSIVGMMYQYDTTSTWPGDDYVDIELDYSSLVAIDSVPFSHKYLATKGLPGSAFFPNATIAERSDDNSYSYYNYSNDSITYYGDFIDYENHHVMSDPQIIMKCPFEFKKPFVDYYEAIDGSFGPYAGAQEVVYDSYVSLILPGNGESYPNTARIVTADSMNALGTITYTTTYSWIDLNSGRTVFEFIDKSIPEYDFFDRQIFHYKYNLIPTSTIETPSQNSISLFPNPVASQGQIKVVNANSKAKTIEIFDLTGKQILGISVLESSTYSFSAEGLASGLYVFYLKEGNLILQSGKLIVE